MSAERLGIGPAEVLARNPRVVYGRMTGWGQDGPLAPRAGHDLTYLALTGLLNGIGTPDAPPVPPVNYVRRFRRWRDVPGGRVARCGAACACHR